MSGHLMGYQFALAMFALMASGCGASSVSTMSNSAGMQSRRGVKQQTEALAAVAPEGSSVVRMAGEADRLAMDVGRAMGLSHWGRLHVRSYVPVKESGDGTANVKAQVVVHARALVPGSREAKVVAWAVEDGEIVVAVRVGYFGDARAEAAYLEQLRGLLEGEPPAARDWKFRLPANMFGLGSRDKDDLPSEHESEMEPGP